MYRTNAQDEWVENVISRSRHALAAIDPHEIEHVTTYFATRAPLFWDVLPPVPDNDRNFPLFSRQADRNFGFFKDRTSFQERSRFVANQKAALADMDAQLLAVDGPVLKKLHDIEVERCLASATSRAQGMRMPVSTANHILERPEYFDINPRLHFLTRLSDIAVSLVTTEKIIESKQDLGQHLSAHLRKAYDIDLTPGSILRLMDLKIYPAIQGQLQHIFSERKSGVRPALIKPATPDPDKIKIGFKAGEHFAEETKRNQREQKREKGGRAGLGAAKPDLWKPEN